MTQEFKNIEDLERELERIQKSTKTLFKVFLPFHDKLRLKYSWYYKWHTFSYAKAVHVAVLILFVFSTVVSSYLTLSSFAPKQTMASGYTWGGGGSTNNFSEAANWVGGVVPGENADVFFNATSTKNATVDAAFLSTISDLTIESGYTGTITATNLLQISGDLTIANGVLEGDVDFGANLNVTGGDLASNTTLKTFYNLGLTVGANGTINGLAEGTHTAKASKARDKSYQIIASDGYQIAELLADEVAVAEAVGDTDYTHTFSAVANATHTLAVTFEATGGGGGGGEEEDPVLLTVSGLTGDAASGNGEYSGNASVGFGQAGGTYTRSTGIEGEYGEITYSIVSESWEAWDNYGTWVIYRSDGGATWDAVASGTFKGSPIGDWDGDVTSTGTYYTITVSDNSEIPQVHENGAQPAGSIIVYAGDTFYCNAGLIIDTPGDPWSLDYIEVDSVNVGTTWAGNFADVDSNHTFHAVYAP